jgi:tRNA pseudouridine38-40 synthase
VEKRRYALRLAYDGAAFRGFQRQPGLPSVQESLSEALSHIGVHGQLEAAARTDAGVHALDQVVTFSARLALEPAELRAAVNAATPPGLVCLDAARVPDRFGARASARTRTYVYLVGWPAPPEAAPYAWSLPDVRAFPDRPVIRFDVEAARTALQSAVGDHDFAGFARPGDQTARRGVDPRATVRTVLAAEVIASEALPLAALRLTGRGFLRAMVRNLVGAAVSAAVGAASPEVVSQLLAAPARRWRGPRAPGWGLTLARVDYGETPFSSGASPPCP